MRDFFAKIRGSAFIFWCRVFRRNISIGKGLKIYKRLIISGNGKVLIGRNCLVDGIYGDNNQYVSIDTCSPDAVIAIGDNVQLYAARVSAKFQITIGNDVLVEESGIVDTDFHSIDRGRGKPYSENKDKCKVHIGSRVCVGARSYITKGLTIEDDVIIMPGSIVTMSVKSGSVICGNPAKPAAIFNNK